MPSAVGTSLGAVSIKMASATTRASSSFTTQQVLREIGKKEGVLDTAALEKLGLGASFSQFDISAVTPVELGLISKNLYALGLIDKITANLMVAAGTHLDALGNQTRPNEKMNALDYFAARISSLRTATSGLDEYGFHVVPDYIKTVHALQNLDDFARIQNARQRATSSLQQQGQAASAQQGSLHIKV
ncbi:hypothetical protein ACIQAL_14155 [Pseudomonas sp. NPDC088368]|uniref:hypothetical protein n=1 Tax=Pseudomonas sp. NPDC088368 TaxID=3364453 RepID=UPI0038034DB4